MLKTITIIVAIIVAGVLGLAAIQPDRFRVQREIVVKAPPEKIYPLIEDFRRWSAWSPWEKLDPAMQRDFGGPPSGKGASYAWSGNDDVGQGRMEITEATPRSRIVIQLDFIKPFAASNVAEFDLVPEAEATRVRWAMHGPSPFLSRIIQVFASMDSLVGKDFEAGLANLKVEAER